MLTDMLLCDPVFLPRSPSTLRHPVLQGPHPLRERLRLTGCLISGVGLSGGAPLLILASWRTVTQRVYETHLCQWFRYCDREGADWTRASPQVCANFLAQLFDSAFWM